MCCEIGDFRGVWPKRVVFFFSVLYRIFFFLIMRKMRLKPFRQIDAELADDLQSEKNKPTMLTNHWSWLLKIRHRCQLIPFHPLSLWTHSLSGCACSCVCVCSFPGSRNLLYISYSQISHKTLKLIHRHNHQQVNDRKISYTKFPKRAIVCC